MTERTEAEIANSLVGRTIVAVEWNDASPDQEWTEHEYCVLTLDDGRFVTFGAWGFDAWGATINEGV